MTRRSPFRYFKTSPEIIRLAVMLHIRFPLSLRNLEDLLHERGIEVSHEKVQFWWNRFGPMFAAEIRRRRRDAMRSVSRWRWHLDEMFVKVALGRGDIGRLDGGSTTAPRTRTCRSEGASGRCCASGA